MEIRESDWLVTEVVNILHAVDNDWPTEDVRKYKNMDLLEGFA